MTLLEKQSKRKCKALKTMVESGEYSPAYALEKLEDYFDRGKVIEVDYEELAEYLEELMNTPEIEEETIDDIEELIEEPTEEGE